MNADLREQLLDKRLSWVLRANITWSIHRDFQLKYGIGWTAKKTAEYLAQNINYTTEFIRLGSFIKRYPILMKLPNKKTALKLIKEYENEELRSNIEREYLSKWKPKSISKEN